MEHWGHHYWNSKSAAALKEKMQATNGSSELKRTKMGPGQML